MISLLKHVKREALRGLSNTEDQKSLLSVQKYSNDITY